MLHKVIFHANNMTISYWQVQEYVYKIYFNFASVYCQNTTRDVGLSNSMVWPKK